MPQQCDDATRNNATTQQRNNATRLAFSRYGQRSLSLTIQAGYPEYEAILLVGKGVLGSDACVTSSIGFVREIGGADFLSVS